MLLEIPTEHGICRWQVAEAKRPKAVLALGPGSNGKSDSAELVALSQRLPEVGFTVARLEPAWVIAGKSSSASSQVRDQEWAQAVKLLAAHYQQLPLYAGGRSAGAATACRGASSSLTGIVALAYPLHAPGKKLVAQADDLAEIDVPILFVSGDRDPFGSPAEFGRVLLGTHRSSRYFKVIEGAAHQFPESTCDEVTRGVLEFMQKYTPHGHSA